MSHSSILFTGGLVVDGLGNAPARDDFNAVLARNGEIVERARAQAGNLAHAIKTPLAAMGGPARPAPCSW